MFDLVIFPFSGGPRMKELEGKEVTETMTKIFVADI